MHEKVMFIAKNMILYNLFQVPMFFRLVELCVALYYGTLEVPNADVDSDIGADAVMVQGRQLEF